MNNVIVTGATGEIGLALIDELLLQNNEITALVRPYSKRCGRLPHSEHLHIVECEMSEMLEYVNSGRLSGSFDVFYHLGWDYSRDHNHVDKHLLNVRYTLDAIEAAVKLECQCFVGAGSQAEYGRVDGRIDESTPCFPETAYGIAKHCAGRMGELSCSQKGIRFVWPRIFSVYGPGDAESTMVMSVIRQLLAGKEPALTKGEQMWDFLYATDAARALRLLGENNICEGIYCIASGETRQLRCYIEELRDCIDTKMSLGFGAIPYSKKQVMNLNVDITKLINETGFQAESTFTSGIQRTIQWCREHPQIVNIGYGA